MGHTRNADRDYVDVQDVIECARMLAPRELTEVTSAASPPAF
jgi:hypothetical protein